MNSLSQSIARITELLAKCGCSTKPVVPADPCENLKNGKQYYLKSSDGRVAVLDTAKQLAFLKPSGATNASKFTATKVGCNLYGLCVDGACMSRCAGCRPDTGDVQSVKFHLTNSNEPYSRWTLVSAGSDGSYNLKIDGDFGYLTFKRTPSGDDQLTLTTTLSNETKFTFVEV